MIMLMVFYSSENNKVLNNFQFPIYYNYLFSSQTKDVKMKVYFQKDLITSGVYLHFTYLQVYAFEHFKFGTIIFYYIFLKLVFKTEVRTNCLHTYLQ